MRISIIAAMAEGRVIGFHNQLPWQLPADLQHFKAITMGKPILMGRKTYESIGRPLPGRQNIVVSRQAGFVVPGCEVFASLDEALAHLADAEEVMIIGGAKIYEQALPKADRLYLTFIHQAFEGDVFFPAWNPEDWKEIERQDFTADDTNPFDYSFVVLE